MYCTILYCTVHSTIWRLCPLQCLVLWAAYPAGAEISPLSVRGPPLWRRGRGGIPSDLLSQVPGRHIHWDVCHSGAEESNSFVLDSQWGRDLVNGRLLLLQDDWDCQRWGNTLDSGLWPSIWDNVRSFLDAVVSLVLVPVSHSLTNQNSCMLHSYWLIQSLLQ